MFYAWVNALDCTWRANLWCLTDLHFAVCSSWAPPCETLIELYWMFSPQVTQTLSPLSISVLWQMHCDDLHSLAILLPYYFSAILKYIKSAFLALVSTCFSCSIIYEVTGMWLFGKLFCKVWISFDVMFCTASIVTLCFISLDRYCSVVTPSHYSRRMSRGRWVQLLLIPGPSKFSLGHSL